MAIASSRLGQHDHVRAIANALEGALGRTGADRAIVLAAAQMVIHLIVVGRADRGEQLYDRLESAAKRFLPGDPVIAARLEIVRGWRAVHAGDSGAHLDHMTRSIEFLALTGDVRNECKERVNLGFALNELGQYEEAETPLLDAMATADRMGIGAVVATARQNLAVSLARQGRLDEAQEIAEEALAAFRAQGNRRMQTAASISLATILKRKDDLDGALLAAQQAVEAGGAPPDRCQALASLAEILLARRSWVEALDAARDANELLASLGGIDEGEALVRLVYAQALAHTGHQGAAGEAITFARDRLLARAAKIHDPAQRATFLERVPDNALTLELAGKWLK
jgi:tetratricopeptide (TPR) repeat protein